MSGPDILNGSKGLVGTAVALASIGGILLHGVYDQVNALQRGLDLAREERREIREEFKQRAAELQAGKEINQKAITALQSADVEIETQLRSVSTIANMERQMTEIVMDLLQQCPTCKVPARIYFPPGPGPDGKEH